MVFEMKRNTLGRVLFMNGAPIYPGNWYGFTSDNTYGIVCRGRVNDINQMEMVIYKNFRWENQWWHINKIMDFRFCLDFEQYCYGTWRTAKDKFNKSNGFTYAGLFQAAKKLVTE